MRVALKWANMLDVQEVAERPELELEVVRGQDGLSYICCKQDFSSYEKARPHIKRAWRELGGFRHVRAEICVKEDNLEGFISIDDYAVKLERRLQGGSTAPDLLASHMKHVGP